jgi:hypothetical protein
MRSLLLFAGAGASKAVNASEYPTTVEFFQGLPQPIKDNPSFKLALRFLTEDHSDRVVDIEQVVWVLEELHEFLQDIHDTKTVPGWFLGDNHLGEMIGAKLDYLQLFNASPQVRGRLKSLIEQIDLRVYELYAREPEPSELESNWLPLLRSLLDVAVTCELFTTNYDINIEVALDLLARNPKLPTIDSGRRGAVQRHLDVSLWRGAGQRDPRCIGLLTKLHGSIDWGRGPSRIFVGDPLFKGTHERHVIVYPGFKGVPQSEPFSAFHAHLAKSIGTATDLVFIGFAFRDEYINNLLSRLTSPQATIVVLNPAETPDQPYDPNRVRHVREPFGLDSPIKVLEALSISTQMGGA